MHLNGEPLVIMQGDVMEKLAELPDESVQMCVTSPPYWGLRDYGTGEWEGGEAGCDHVEPPRGGRNPETAGKQLTDAGRLTYQFAGECGKCGAKRVDAQLGLEKTPEEYVGRMVEVMREVRRVLRRDGVLFLNLGDSYAAANNRNDSGRQTSADGDSERDSSLQFNHGTYRKIPGLKPKDLCGIPWRVAFALQGDGWWLRQDIIWAKPNPMPESVSDRCTKSHEYVFLLVKSASYFYDAEAIKEKSIHAGRIVKYDGSQKNCTAGDAINDRRTLIQKNTEVADSRNKHSVWTIATQSYPEAHFATYPPDLVKPCILAGSKPGDAVLDPFAGSGTTGAVALELGRKAILIELNPSYVKLIEERCNTTMGLALA